MQGNHWRTMLCEVCRDGGFAIKPRRATARARGIRDNAGHERIGESDNDGVGILQDIAAIGSNAVLQSDVLCGENGRFHEQV
ncbi:MAG: hypothetical protein RL117_1802 [Verrucomicrobiota bacterium]|jgi:hypothetical protein